MNELPSAPRRHRQNVGYNAEAQPDVAAAKPPADCAATPRIRVVESLALRVRELPSGWKEEFDGISQTGQPVAPDLPAADLPVPSSGCPDSLEGKQIPIFARIAGIIDTYNAMTHDRFHRKAVAPHTVLQALYKWRNNVFQDELIEQFLQCVGVYPTASIIEMSTGEVGMVIAQSNKQRLKPRIMMLLDEHKEPYPGLKIVDLQTQAVDHNGHEYTRLHGLKPGTYGINPVDYKL